MKKPTFVVIGYSLDSAFHAREMASDNFNVIYLQTGKLGHPLDDIREYISYEDMLKIHALGVKVPFKKLYNSTFMFVPYDQLKFVNSKNGLINYPLNSSSFESAEEWEQIESCLSNINDFRNELSNASNFINIYKNFFPKWLYDCMLKYIGVNKWAGFRQSKFTRNALAKEIDLSCLDCSNTGTIYKPEISYEELCEMMLDHEKITRKTITVNELREFIIQRHKDTEIVLMDNRVDYICNYTHGNIERVDFKIEKSDEQNMEEFIDVNQGIVFTPTKEYFCTANELGDIIKITSEKIEDLTFKGQSNIIPTNFNRKLISEYTKMLKLYSGKYLNLNSFFTGTVQ